MTKFMQADDVQRRKPVVVRCCLKAKAGGCAVSFAKKWKKHAFRIMLFAVLVTVINMIMQNVKKR